ncbi:hypothetical protein MKW94_011610 [Papaver nudicaule]|uniref:3'-5' exonuclease domain-containing protein n=1 Tax=Papaver nudicaule TaxID=74823 RepID=A0AA41VRB4_PAPNU|nr:hypothetical protein [Papaver nudicaule]
MAGELLVQEVQNGLDGLSVNGDDKTNWGDMSSDQSSTDGSSVHGGDDKNTYIEVVDKSMSTHHIHNVYFYKEKIETTVAYSAYVVDQWIKVVNNDNRMKLDNVVVGLDVEYNRMRKQGKQNSVAVLQLCVGRCCLIFHISCCDAIPPSLDDFLGNEKFIFVGVGIESDAYNLVVDYELKVARTEELGSMAAYKLTNTFEDCRDSHFHKAGLKQLAKDVLNQELPKERRIQWSDWEDFLSDEQVEYACLDAFVSFKLGVHLMNRANPVHKRENNNNQNNNPQQKKSSKDPSEPKKGEEEKTKQQQVPLKSNGGNKTTGTNSKRTN